MSQAGDAANKLMNSLNVIMESNRQVRQGEIDRKENLRRFELMQKNQKSEALFQKSSAIGESFLKWHDNAKTTTEQDHARAKWDSYKTTLAADPEIVKALDGRFSRTSFGNIKTRERFADDKIGKVTPNLIDPKANPLAWHVKEMANKEIAGNRNAFVHGITKPKTPAMIVTNIGEIDYYAKRSPDGAWGLTKVGEEDAQALAGKYNTTVAAIHAQTPITLGTSRHNLGGTSMDRFEMLNPSTEEVNIVYKESKFQGKIIDTTNAKGKTAAAELSKDEKAFLIGAAGTNTNGEMGKHGKWLEKQANMLLATGAYEDRFDDHASEEFKADLAGRVNLLYPNMMVTFVGEIELDDPWVNGAETFSGNDGWGMIGVIGQPREFSRSDGTSVVYAVHPVTQTVRDKSGNPLGTIEEVTNSTALTKAPTRVATPTDTPKKAGRNFLQAFTEKKAKSREKKEVAKKKKVDEKKKEEDRIRKYWAESDNAESAFAKYLADTFGIGREKRHYADLPKK